MKVRNGLAKTRMAVLLATAALTAPAAFTVQSYAADANAPVLKAPPADAGWYYHGLLEAVENMYIQRPGSGFGYAPNGNFLTASQTDSRAKFEEYGRVPSGPFVDRIDLHTGSKDGRYSVDFWARHIGFNNQSYYLDLTEAGKQYLTVGWDQTPHLYSTSAKTLFTGVGTTNLTVADPVQAALQAQMANAAANTAAGQTARNNINNIINSNAMNVDIATRRDKFIAGYRNTMLEDWDFDVDYTNEHRSGTKPGSVNWGYGNNANPAFPTSGVVGIPVPIDDRTQNADASAEHVGVTPFGTKYNVVVRYAGSFYDDSLTRLTADNPFCLTCAFGAGADRGPNFLNLALPPSNMANAVTVNGGADIPIFKSHYTTTFQYNAMRQNDPFQSSSSNGIVAPALPAASLNGAVDTLLTNNVLTSRLTNDVSSTFRFRYYDRDNTTPSLTFADYNRADSGLAGTTVTNTPLSYKKTNVSEELKWRTPIHWLSFGGGYFFERYNYTNAFINQSNENTGKVFADATPWSRVHAWASYSYAGRRYDSYSQGPADWLIDTRTFNYANRDRQKGEALVDFAVARNVMITPSASVRWDDYPDPVQNLLGVSSDHSWKAGVRVRVALAPTFNFSVAYNHEDRNLQIADATGGANIAGLCPNAGTYLAPAACTWSDNIGQRYDTFFVNAKWDAVPSKLDFSAEYMYSLSNEGYGFTPCSTTNAANVNCNGMSIAGYTGPTTYPDEKVTHQSFNLIGRYFVDPDVVRQMGWVSEVVVKMRYAYERNTGSYFASDSLTPYFGTLTGAQELTSASRSIFLAGYNPNYTAQLLATSVSFKW